MKAKNRSSVCLLVIVLGLLLCRSECTFSQTLSGAREFVEQYSAAFLRKDANTVLSMMHPGEIEKLGGIEVARRDLAEIFKGAEMASLQPTEERVNEIRSFGYPTVVIYLVRTTRYTESFPVPMKTPHVYVVTFAKISGAYNVIDLSCIGADKLRMLIPEFRDTSAIDQLLKRQ